MSAASHSSSMFTVSHDGKVTQWSSQIAKLTGYKSGDILGKHFRILNSVENLRREKSEEVLRLVLSEGKITYADWHVKKDGSHFWASMEITLLTGKPGHLPTFSIEMLAASQTNQVAEKFRAHSAELERQLGERTAELGEITAQLDERTDELGDQTTQLGERTNQLSAKIKEFNTIEALNKELEAFTYAASHDLRAPLRSIDGFGQALLEDYSDKLDEEGQHYLRRIRASAQRMGHLIDDLIGLASLTRVTLKRSPCDLSFEAKKIAIELKRMKPDRKVDFEFPESLMVYCDVPLMRIVLENLLGNAFKYTSKIPLAKIEVGFIKMSDGNIYFVKDNGAGFDMKYAHKLFGPFQRLHAVTDFEGNGIGLATVQRIIHRHGGEVWAESEVDKGTTIFFTI